MAQVNLIELFKSAFKNSTYFYHIISIISHL